MVVKPVSGGPDVFDPLTKTFIPPEGITVGEFDLYWHRRLRDGDVEIVKSDAAPQASNAKGAEE